MRRAHFLVLFAITAAVTSDAQSNSALPRTPDGHPDFQGTWDNWMATPLERPREFADKTHFTREEAAAYLSHNVDRFRAARGEEEFKSNGEIDGLWAGPARLGPSFRTSIIIDPPDGRLPPLTAEAQARLATRAAARQGRSIDNPEELPLGARCIVWGAGPPMLPMFQNSNLQIAQTRDTALFVTEMIHDARIVPLDGSPHLPQTIHRLTGDSRGRWDGDTLVVDTTNFTDQTELRGTTAARHVIERFTLLDADTIRYEFTVEDRTSLSRPWTGETYLIRTQERIFEYACHEGNYSMELILKGARAAEKP